MLLLLTAILAQPTSEEAQFGIFKIFRSIRASGNSLWWQPLERTKNSTELEFEHGAGYANDLFVQGHLVTFAYMRSSTEGATLFQYNQVKSVVNDLMRRYLLWREMTKFE